MTRSTLCVAIGTSESSPLANSPPSLDFRQPGEPGSRDDPVLEGMNPVSMGSTFPKNNSLSPHDYRCPPPPFFFPSPLHQSTAGVASIPQPRPRRPQHAAVPPQRRLPIPPALPLPSRPVQLGRGQTRPRPRPALHHPPQRNHPTAGRHRRGRRSLPSPRPCPSCSPPLPPSGGGRVIPLAARTTLPPPSPPAPGTRSIWYEQTQPGDGRRRRAASAK